MANLDLKKVQIVDDGTQTDLGPISLAESIYFNDGETLQFKFDNAKLFDDNILEGVQAVSPTVEVYENTKDTYILIIKDINGTIITPNLKGEKGEDGFDLIINVNTDTDDTYTLDITDATHTFETPNLKGFSPKVEVTEDTDDTYTLKITDKHTVTDTPNLKGFSPNIEVLENDDYTYKLKITDKYDTIETPNLKGGQGIPGVSPRITVFENTDTDYRLRIEDAEEVIVTPNLKGPDGASLQTFEYRFTDADWAEVNKGSWLLRINHTLHQLGFTPRVGAVMRYASDTELVSVVYDYKRLVNGDVVLLVNEPFTGIALLEGETE